MLETSIMESCVGVLAEGSHVGVNCRDSGVGVMADEFHDGVFATLELIRKAGVGCISAVLFLKYFSSSRYDLRQKSETSLSSNIEDIRLFNNIMVVNGYSVLEWSVWRVMLTLQLQSHTRQRSLVE